MGQWFFHLGSRDPKSVVTQELSCDELPCSLQGCHLSATTKLLLLWVYLKRSLKEKVTYYFEGGQGRVEGRKKEKEKSKKYSIPIFLVMSDYANLVMEGKDRDAGQCQMEICTYQAFTVHSYFSQGSGKLVRMWGVIQGGLKKACIVCVRMSQNQTWYWAATRKSWISPFIQDQFELIAFKEVSDG